MPHKETFHLPSVGLEMDFSGDESQAYELKNFRSTLRERLMKYLIADGVAFQEREQSAHWSGGDDAVARLEQVVDTWILTNKFPCSKFKDNHSRKVRWVLECEEQVTLLMMPATD